MKARSPREQGSKGLVGIGTISVVAMLIPAMVAGAAPNEAAGNAESDDDAVQLPDVKIIGQRLSIEEAIRLKRDAANVVDVSASDDIGRLPDRNIGDALSRLPGVSTDQFEGEARFVTIRGLESSLNNLTVDGRQIAVGDDRGRDGRSAALDGLSTAGIAALELIKTPTPDMDAVGIGGTINVISPSAFDRPDGFFGAGMDVSHSEVSDTSVFDWANGEIVSSHIFGDKRQFGLFLSADYLRRDRLVRDRVDNVDWRDFNGVALPDGIDLTRFPIKRDRLNFSTNFDYHPSDSTSLYARVLVTNDQREVNGRSAEQFNVRGDPYEITADGAMLPLRVTLDGWEREQENRTYSLTVGGESHISAFTVDYDLGYARAVSDRSLWSQMRFRTAEFDGELVLDDRIRFEALDQDFLHSPENYVLQRVRFDSIKTVEEMWSPSLDLAWDGNLFGAIGRIKGGLKATLRDKSVDARSDRYLPLETLTLADHGFLAPGPGNPGFPYGGDFFQGSYTAGPAVNSRAVSDYFFNHPDRFQFLETESMANDLEDDFDADEKVWAGYLMGQVDTGRALWTAGFRVEHTNYSTQAARVTLADDEIVGITPVKGGRTYTDILPNIQLRYLLAENVFMRAALTQSIGRPDFVAAAPIQEFEIEQVGTDDHGNPVYIGSLDTGNPELNRIQSSNYDLSLEYYPSTTGLFAVALFYKDIKNPIFDRREIQFETEFDGVALESLRITGYENADSGKVRGIELSAQEQFRFLPAPFDNFGMSVNYTLVDSESDVIERDDDLPFFGQADRIANAALFYQQGGFEARLAYRYRDEFLESLGGDPTQDIYRDRHEQLDFKVSYRFRNGLRVFGDVWNLTNEQPRLFQGRRSRFWGMEDTGRIITVGLQWTTG